MIICYVRISDMRCKGNENFAYVQQISPKTFMRCDVEFMF